MRKTRYRLESVVEDFSVLYTPADVYVDVSRRRVVFDIYDST